jgi:hypothetical protein
MPSPATVPSAFHSLDFNGDPISTGSVNVTCVHT